MKKSGKCIECGKKIEWIGNSGFCKCGVGCQKVEPLAREVLIPRKMLENIIQLGKDCQAILDIEDY